MGRECKLTFDAETHTYRIDGRAVPSVTQVIEYVMPSNYGPMTDEHRDYVMNRGSAVHHGCRLADEGRLDWATVAPEIEQRIRAWLKFRADHPHWEIVLNETPLGSNLYGFAGTPDRLFRHDGHYNLVDLKGTIVPQNRIQLGGYHQLLSEKRYDSIQNAVLVALNDDGTYRAEWTGAFELRRMKNLFLSCLSMFNFMQEHNLLKGDR